MFKDLRKNLTPNKLALAGLAAVIVVAGLVLLSSRVTDPGEDSTPSRVVLVYPRDGATLVLLHHFSWRKTGQPSVYRFFLYQLNRTPIWSTLVKDSSLILPPTVPLHRGRTYLWRVEAILADEKTIDSEARTFSLSQ